MKIARVFFSTAFAVGGVAVLATIGFLFPEWSPYRSLRPGGFWFVPQFAAATLLVYAGAFGFFAITPRALARPWIGVSVLVLLMTLLGLTLFMDMPEPRFAAQLADQMAAIAGAVSAALAFLAGGLCLWYMGWHVRHPRS